MKRQQNKTKIVFDSTILASTLLGGVTRKQFLEVLDFSNQIDIYYCQELLDDIRKLSQSTYFIAKGISLEIINAFITLFEKRAIQVALFSDKAEYKENYLFALSEKANLEYLITEDEDLLVRGSLGSAKILQFQVFIEGFNFLPF